MKRIDASGVMDVGWFVVVVVFFLCFLEGFFFLRESESGGGIEKGRKDLKQAPR